MKISKELFKDIVLENTGNLLIGYSHHQDDYEVYKINQTYCLVWEMYDEFDEIAYYKAIGIKYNIIQVFCADDKDEKYFCDLDWHRHEKDCKVLTDKEKKRN